MLQLCASTGTRGLSLVCYLENIRDRYVVDENIFFQILFVWKENDLGF